MSALTAAPAARRVRALRWAAIVAVVLVPLAFAGLFLASVGDPAAGAERVPVAIVNDDEAIVQTDDEGEEQYILAGRQLVTELMGPDSPAGLDWRLTNDEDAQEMLAAGEVYAVLTIPEGFSEAILSTSGDAPQKASIAIRTDDARSYTAGAVAAALGDGMVRAFGSAITEQFIVGVFDEVGSSLAGAADAAGQLADGAGEAASGATEFAEGVGDYTGGVSQLAGGARDLSQGVGDYTGGVAQLADGLDELRRETRGLGALGSGTAAYTAGVSQLSQQLADASRTLIDSPGDPAALATVHAVSAALEQLAQQGTALGQGAAGLGALETGIRDMAAGASPLAAGGEELAAGVGELAAGAGSLSANGAAVADGAADLAAGLDELASGSEEFASGLRDGAEQFAGEEGAVGARAEVAADPVGYELATDNAVEGATQAIATPLVPLALWIGALVGFLAVPPLTRGVLGSTAASGRLLAGTLARASAVTGAQAVLLVGLLHLVAGVGWALLPATLVFSLLTAVAFTAFHAALTIAFGRPGLIGSFIALALQLAALGVVVPVEALAPPFAAVSPYLPLSWATTGLQQIITGGSASAALGAAASLVAFGLASVVLAGVALARTRRAAALGLLPASV